MLAAEFLGNSALQPPQLQPQPQPQSSTPQPKQMAEKWQGHEAQQAAPAASTAPVMLVSMQRCSEVHAILSGLGMSPKQVLGPLGVAFDSVKSIERTAKLCWRCPP